MSRKISLKDLSKICGGKQRATIFEIIDFLRRQDNSCTVKEIQKGIGYKESSRHIYELISRLSEIGFIEKVDTKAKPPFKYKVTSREFVISLDD